MPLALLWLLSVSLPIPLTRRRRSWRLYPSRRNEEGLPPRRAKVCITYLGACRLHHLTGAPTTGAARRVKKVKKGEEEEEEVEVEDKEKGREDQERAEGGATEPKEVAEANEEKKEEQPSRFLEKGLIYFFYRPKVGVEEVHDIDDVSLLPSLY
jgi:hypothetical protein